MADIHFSLKKEKIWPVWVIFNFGSVFSYNVEKPTLPGVSHSPAIKLNQDLQHPVEIKPLVGFFSTSALPAAPQPGRC